MALTLKLLGFGTLPSSVGDLLTSPPNIATVIKTVSVVNTDSNPRKFALAVKIAGGTIDHGITPAEVILNSGCQAIYDTEITLGPGDLLRGYSVGSSTLEYVVGGMERNI